MKELRLLSIRVCFIDEAGSHIEEFNNPLEGGEYRSGLAAVDSTLDFLVKMGFIDDVTITKHYSITKVVVDRLAGR